MSKLNKSFYCSNNILDIAQSLLGKILYTNFSHKLTGGMIVEVEAYLGATDKACHSYNNKRTKRTEAMFESGGVSYVYLCYGMHYLFNIVVGEKNNPCAILIRAIEPIDGIKMMLKRRNFTQLKNNLTNGPGKLTQSLGITNKFNKQSLIDSLVWIEDQNIKIMKKDILSSSRIGVDYAGEDAKLPYRFYIKNNQWVSKT
ncbi:MAG: 3-methyladenine DNA glycosylase [Candidatus Marinimicrobia bacterium]|nr:3-methyladenine DNA glycosylase [Candidatus Neomarinimicrobiota bacterium]|tara:strand:+ start:1023 stop:1622 length:600 start_codon:yes stop_codon:yes gene_type:complete